MTRLGLRILNFVVCAGAAAKQGGAGATGLTIHNQDFAVARTTVDLELKAGTNLHVDQRAHTIDETFAITDVDRGECGGGGAYEPGAELAGDGVVRGVYEEG